MSSNQPPATFLTARIIHGALLGGQVLFLLIVLMLIKENLGFTPQNNSAMIAMVCFAMAIPMMFIAPFIEKSIYKGANDSEISPTQRQTGLIIKYALWEGPCLFAIIVMLISKSLVTLPIVLIIFALFILNGPKAEHFDQSL